jgi:hypothetical protein
MQSLINRAESRPLIAAPHGAQAYTAVQEFDTDNAQFGRDKDARQSVLEQRHMEFYEDFYRIFLSAKDESLDGLTVARCLESNVSGSDLHAIFKAIVLGQHKEASLLVREALSTAAHYFADAEELSS